MLEYIRQHPGVPQTALPGDLQWTQGPLIWKHAVWDAAQQKGVVQLMPLEEANAYQQYYSHMAMMSQQFLEAWDAINDAARFNLLEPDPTHLSPQQLDSVIQLTLTALAKHVLFGYSFGLYAHRYPNSHHTITWDAIAKLRPEPSVLDPQGMAAPHQKTVDRLKAANSGPNGTTIDAQALK